MTNPDFYDYFNQNNLLLEVLMYMICVILHPSKLNT